jgi:hypothetical protein
VALLLEASHNEISNEVRYENPIISLAYLHDSSTLAMAEGNGQIRLLGSQHRQ